MWSNTRYRLKVYADQNCQEMIEDMSLMQFIRNDAGAKYALSNSAKPRSDLVQIKVHAANFHGTPYFSWFYERQVFLKIYLPDIDVSKYLW